MSQPTAPKQNEARERVLDLIEQLSIGDAIPSERQLSADLRMSRLTVRAALDDLVRDGLLVRRRGSGTFVGEPKIAQELTMTSFSEDMRRRGMVPGNRTLSIVVVQAGAHLGRLLMVSPSEPVVVFKRLRLADRETMAIETLHVRQSLIPGLTGGGSRAALLLRAPRGPLRRRDGGRHADDRADGHQRGGVGGAGRAAPLAGVPVRAHDPHRERATSSSTCARSTAATATGSSPSWPAATPARDADRSAGQYRDHEPKNRPLARNWS